VSGFGSGGRVLTDYAGHDDQVAGLSVLPNGKVVAGGEFGPLVGFAYRYGVTRYTSSGGLDPAFGGGDGMGLKNMGNLAGARSFALRPDGSSVVGGYSGGDQAYVSFTASGTVDTGFSKNGGGVHRFRRDLRGLVRAGGAVGRLAHLGRSGRVTSEHGFRRERESA
jgi:Domain of unknown function (DUF5122) beta-propeller